MLVLRAPTESDGAHYEAVLADPVVAKALLYPAPAAIHAADLAHWEREGWGPWLWFSGDEVVGRGGLNRTSVGGEDSVEVAYAVRSAFQGQGFASEMARRSIQHAWDLGLPEVVGFAWTENTASIWILQKVGLVFEREIEHAGLPHWFGRIRRAAEATLLNEHELWRSMVRWSGGHVIEEDGVLLVSGPSAYLRVAMRTDPGTDAAVVVKAAKQFFGIDPLGYIVLVQRPHDADIEAAALAAGFRPGWTEQPMVLIAPPEAAEIPSDIEVSLVTDEAGVVDYGRVVAQANDDPGERERAPLLFHDTTILIPNVKAYVAYAGKEPVACAMTLVSHGVAGVFYVGTVPSARRRGLGDALTRLAARAGFALGAGAAWLGASEAGASLYRRIGFAPLGTAMVEFESPED